MTGSQIPCVKNLENLTLGNRRYLRNLFTNLFKKSGYVDDWVFDWMELETGGGGEGRLEGILDGSEQKEVTNEKIKALEVDRDRCDISNI